ncbi:MAG TPA: hypothetical protein VKB67_07410 [Rhizomicrobium sp.]|nr:hypothetical protein [Rhizomicrobium sp.]
MGFLGDGDFWLGLVAGVFLGIWLLRNTREYKAYMAQETQKQIEKERASLHDPDWILNHRTGADDDFDLL